MTRATKHATVALGVLAVVLLALVPSASASRADVTLASLDPFSFGACFNCPVNTMLGPGGTGVSVNVVANAYLTAITGDSPTGAIFSYVYEITPSGMASGATLKLFRIRAVFKQGLAFGTVTDLNACGVDCVLNSVLFDKPGGKTEWHFDGVQNGETIALYAQTFFQPGRRFADAFAGNGGPAEGMVLAPVPEPGTMFLLGSGLVGAGLFLRRRRRAS